MKLNSNSFIFRTPLGRGFFLLPKIHQRKIVLIVLLQIFLSLFDLLGVVAIGTLGALSVQGIESHSPGNRVGRVLRLLGVQNLSFQLQVAILGVAACSLFVIKTVVSIQVTRKSFSFLNHQASELTSNLFKKILGQNLVEIQKRPTQEILYIITTGVSSIMNGLLATSIGIFADFTMMVILSIGLFFVDPAIAFTTTALFFVVIFTLHRLMQVRAKRLGVLTNQLSIKSNEKILEVLNSYRESVVRARRSFYGDEVRKLRYDLGKVAAETNFMPYVGKYVIESVGIFGAFALGAFEFSRNSAVHAVAVLAVFMAATTRIGPAALRVQQGMLLMKNSYGTAASTFQLIDEIIDLDFTPDPLTNPDFIYEDFEPDVELKNVTFSYPNNKNFLIDQISLSLKRGSSTALVGPSGSGKTTIIDLLLGILKPSGGSVIISGVSPSEASRQWPGAISYVAQNVYISSGTLKENIALGYPVGTGNLDYIYSALKSSQLLETAESLPEGIETFLGENGARLSGGQRQRIGIARALFTRPKLLIMDESTSSLDGITENSISEAIGALANQVTVVIVAHRLSTVRSVDQIIYVENGKILATGTFEEVRKKIPNFDEQAKLMGL